VVLRLNSAVRVHIGPWMRIAPFGNRTDTRWSMAALSSMLVMQRRAVQGRHENGA
jgi:hypothetical protein